MFSKLRIVTLVRLQLAVLAALLLVTAGLSLVDSWQVRSSVLRVERVNAAVEALLSATENLAVERGTTNTALRGEEPVSTQVRGQIDARRGVADPALAEAFEIMDGLTLPDAEAQIAALRERLQALQQHRAEADRALAQPRGARPEAVVTGWMPTVIAAMEAVSDLSVALGREVKLTDPLVAEQVQVKQLAWAVRDSAGRERATIGGVLASGAGLGEAQRASIAALRGRVDFGWEQIREIAERPGGDPRLAAQVATTQQAYFETFRGRSDAVIDAYGEGEPAPMSGPEWYDLSNPALATLMAVKDASIEVTSDITAGQYAAATRGIMLELLLLALAAAVLLGSVVATQRRLARPVRALTEAIGALARQDYENPVPLREQRDELGVIAGALDGLREEGLRAQRLAAEREAEQAAELERSQRIERLARDFEAKVSESLGHSLQVADRVQTGAGGLSQAAERADLQARSVGESSDQASSNVQTVAAASEELAASIREINQQIVQSRTISDEAVSKARETSASVAGLSEVAARIDAVISLITGIAEQTNLLALNATIEAARAGEAGKGFAVVASEVKNLANQTAKATEEIAAQIHAMQGSTGEVVEAVDGIGATIARLSEFVATIAAAAEEQGAATQEIARNVQEAAAGTQRVNDGMAEVRAVSESTNGLAGEMLSLSQELGDQARSLRGEIDGFLASVRAA